MQPAGQLPQRSSLLALHLWCKNLRHLLQHLHNLWVILVLGDVLEVVAAAAAAAAVTEAAAAAAVTEAAAAAVT
jgi:hypothetical protein